MRTHFKETITQIFEVLIHLDVFVSSKLDGEADSFDNYL